ncbi:MAG: NAD(+) diphosphatase [Candidatus Margulisiibacteriota bacterium]|nr:MAG: hypothetical protein A2X42_00805 [Candidatus Margulisbacteria bacterium GWF2_38_17]OGI11061.1 MAG: hypothetical protein A2X41_02100 [Candidatus Margulisbacteria bacterium GWE2_39_32]PZM80171.1 MAG: NAD(+) diphosphatase [Candidatus Margulisiibacteriota bacterium]HCY35588.1 NAD(+) diphosphatase [Candidatus Margulisiibacteriota bacterium]
MINEILPDQLDLTHKTNILPQPDDFTLLYSNHKVLLKKDKDTFIIPTLKDISSIAKNIDSKFIGTLNGKNYFQFSGNGQVFPEEEYSFFDIFYVRNNFDKPLRWLVAIGYQLYTWHMENTYCGKCGNLLAKKADERALECNRCLNTVYPKISPVIIVAIIKDNEILLARGTNPRFQFYSLIAGFVEIGETLEEAVVREVKEEVGVDVKNIRYYKSQPWPFSSTLMVGFFAEYTGNTEITIDNKEIADAQWFAKDTLPSMPNTDAIGGEMIRVFADS